MTMTTATENPSGTTPGQVVYYVPLPSEVTRFNVRAGEVVVGRISRLSPTGGATIHLDLVDVHGEVGWGNVDAGTQSETRVPVFGPITSAVVRDARHDPAGAPGTWHFPPRV